MGKYTHLLDGIPLAEVSDRKYQDKVDAAKAELTVNVETGELLQHSPETLAKVYAIYRAEEELYDAQRYVAQVKVTAIEQLLVDSWDKDEEGWGTHGAGPNTVVLPDGMKITVEPQPQGQVEDPEMFRQWCTTPTDTCCLCGVEENDFDHEDTEFGGTAAAHKFTPGGGVGHRLSLAYMSMNAMSKERALAGDPPMPGTKVVQIRKVKLSKPKAV